MRSYTLWMNITICSYCGDSEKQMDLTAAVRTIFTIDSKFISFSTEERPCSVPAPLPYTEPSLFLWREKRRLLSQSSHFMAEKEGFEPSIPFWGIHDFQSCALGQLRDFSILSSRCQLGYNTSQSLFCQFFFSKSEKIFSYRRVQERRLTLPSIKAA